MVILKNLSDSDFDYLIRMKVLSLNEGHMVSEAVKNSLDRHKYGN